MLELVDTVLLQVRVSATLLKKIDELCQEGIFKNRSEVVSEAIRSLIVRYSRVSREAKLTALYLSGRLPKGESPDDLVFTVKEPVEVDWDE